MSLQEVLPSGGSWWCRIRQGINSVSDLSYFPRRDTGCQ
ncbi:hypothetical protein AB3S75_046969 [Citrus x aurantiifolia]